MQIYTKAVSLALLALLLDILGGCGAGAPPVALSTSGPSGKVAQGAVSGATVWADTLGSGTQFVIDSTEQGTETTTTSTGAYTLPISPNYKYVLVSRQGTDGITGKTATTLLAPAGSPSISPLTTLVALDTSGNLASTLNTLLPTGKTFDSDVTASGGMTPGSMVFLTSITTAVTIFDETIQDAAHTSDATLTQQQLDYINLTLYSQIATQFSTVSATTLSNTATLAANLQAALSAALTMIAANDSNVVLQNNSSIAATIADNCVAIAANVVGNATGNIALADVIPGNVQTNGVAVSTSSDVTESTVLSAGGNKQAIINIITSLASSTASDVTITSTPANYAPPPIPIINNPTVIGYQLVLVPDGSEWTVSKFTITFSDGMVATESGGTNFAHSVLSPANYQFTQPGCSPTSYASNVVTFTCSTLQTGSFGVTIYQSTNSGGVWASATSLGLSVDNTKVFTVPAPTGSLGGSGVNLF